jgi:hypothetical protein
LDCWTSVQPSRQAQAKGGRELPHSKGVLRASFRILLFFAANRYYFTPPTADEQAENIRRAQNQRRA